MKRPPRRLRTKGWECKLAPSVAADLNGLRAEVDALEVEYERAENDLTLKLLTDARVHLMRRTSALRREVADNLIAVRLTS